MADTLAQLEEALMERDSIRKRMGKLERDSETGGRASGTTASRWSKHSHALSVVENRVSEAQEALDREIEESRAAVASAQAALQELEGRRGTGEIGDEAYHEQAQVLRNGLVDAEARIDVRQRALQAESAADLDWLNSVPSAHREVEGSAQAVAPEQQSVSFSDWPGVSVPERIMMLWRESRKPQSRRSIVTSTALLGLLTLIVIGIVLVSSRMDPKDPTDYLGRGEVMMPVLVDNAQDIRNLEFTLEYDTEVLTGISVVQGDVGRLAFMEYDVDKSGTINVTLRDVTGIDGSGTIVIVRFRANDLVSTPAPVSLSSLAAVDATTMMERSVEGEDGWINTETLDVLAPVLSFP